MHPTVNNSGIFSFISINKSRSSLDGCSIANLIAITSLFSLNFISPKIARHEWYGECDASSETYTYSLAINGKLISTKQMAAAK